MTIDTTRRAALGLLAAALTLASTAGNIAAATPLGGAAWKISLVAQPTNLPLSGHHSGEPNDQYVLLLTNIGSVGSNEAIALTDELPAGVTVGGEFQSTGWACPTPIGGHVVRCTYTGGAVPPLGQSETLTIPVAVGAAGALANRVTVSGGEAPAAVANLTSLGSQATAPFAFLDLSNQASDVFGAPDTQAGDHPYALTTTFDFPELENPETNSPERAVRLPKAMTVDLPAGLVGNPQAATRCTMVAVLSQSCPASSRVGTSFIDFGTGLAGGIGPIYNVVPERGYPAEFALYDERVQRPVFLYATVRTGADYGLRVTVPDIPPAASGTNLVVSFFGDPQKLDGAQNASIPFFTSPSDCSREPLITKIEADSWEEPEHWVSAEAGALPVTGCERLRFQPSLAATPDTSQADTPAGYTADLQIPQSQSTGLEGLATPDLKNATVTLPPGVSLSPAAADGLRGCPAEGPEGINLTSAAAGNCPLASQVGTAEARTPLLETPLQGHLYVALPGCGGPGQNPCTAADATDGNLFSFYLELEGSGVVIKQRGAASANPTTGQITASFKNAPQQPFGDLKLALAGGPRAPLANPQSCAEALGTSDITPWSSPQTPDATPSWEFPVTGCTGPAFAPSFLAGTTNPAGGAYTNFSTTFSRADGMQDLSAIQVQTPIGLLGMLSHVTLCAEPQATLGTCPEAARIGTARVAAGAGSHPFWVSGPVYLTGPYKGAPFGLSVTVAAQAGPFNLGTVVTRAMLNIDPHTAALTVTSDPLPQILDGVPVRVRTVNVTVDKGQFMFNPTSCVAEQVSATMVSAQGASAQGTTPFAAGGCQNLPFKPTFKVATSGRASKAKGASLNVKVTSGAGQANIGGVHVSLPKQLPARLTTLQQACPEATFAQNPAQCPAASVVGTAKAITPVLNEAVSGPAYLVSHGGAAFPDLVVILQGQGIRLDLVGNTNIAKSITTSTFASVPDAPITSFELTLPEGPHSALTTNLPAKARGNLCGSKLTMPTTITGQNGAVIKQSTKIAVSGCPKAKPQKQRRK